jgi:hypothetical protein
MPNKDRPTPEEEKIEAWEFWHQRSIKLEALAYEALRLAERQQAWMEEARKILERR